MKREATHADVSAALLQVAVWLQEQGYGVGGYAGVLGGVDGLKAG